jgi:hypothetical protein
MILANMKPLNACYICNSEINVMGNWINKENPYVPGRRMYFHTNCYEYWQKNKESIRIKMMRADLASEIMEGTP